MKEYDVIVSGGLVTQGYSFKSESRNSKEHLVNTGANECEVYYNGTCVSAARRDVNAPFKAYNIDVSLINERNERENEEKPKVVSPKRPAPKHTRSNNKSQER